MLPKIGFSLQGDYGLPVTQVIGLLKQAGFSSVSPLWSPDLDLAVIDSAVRKNGMTIQSIHAPHKGVPLLWQPDSPDAAAVQENMLRSLDDCAKYHVPVLVAHGWQGLDYRFPDTPLDFRFLDRMVEHAKKFGVSIAFENLEGEEYLAALMARYEGLPHIGYCFDSGHDNCYPHKTDFLKAYGDRLIMTHLNDNFGLRDPAGVPSGNDDLHFLPYDGKIDWNIALGRLASCRKQKTLNFEIKLRSHSTVPADRPYTQLSVEEFIALSGNHARQIAEQYSMLTK